ncbi:MAG: phosphate--AMP phosphotransferase [Peptococcaceae bacterium]|nr:phosphate--AMP phosphotransferase [Peptococcaceae bacterium]
MFKKMKFAQDDPLLSLKISELGSQLASLQRALKDTDRSLLILLSGWEATGKGQILNDLVRELDPRYYYLTQFDDATDVDKKHPMLWRFFQAFPIHGRVGIFDHSFYRELMRHPDVSEMEFLHAVRDIRFTERLLTNDGCLVVKFFLDQSKVEMSDALDALAKDKSRSFLLEDFDKYQLKHYDTFRDHFERIINATTSLNCPWRVLDASDKKMVSKKILATLIRCLQWHLDKPPATCAEPLPPVVCEPLATVDLSKSISEEAYHAKLRPLQKEAADLLYQLYLHKVPAIVVFEGTDASGKGGCIKRLTRQMDPRSYSVATTAAPTKFELEHHYLWRFYQTFPTPGHLTIYDRSWYGRVMVERIEGFASTQRWQDAYAEINEMEASLVEDGYLLLKFLLIINKEEQLARFKDRENTPEKHYKITDEDWRNHDKFDDYVEAMNDMVVRTSTNVAPWIVLPSMDKRYARIHVLEHFVQAARQALTQRDISVTVPRALAEPLRDDLKKETSNGHKDSKKDKHTEKG